MNKNFLKYIPFTYQWIIRNAIGIDIKTVLDLGCGDGYFMKILSSGEAWEITGIELYNKYLKEIKKTGIYKSIKRGDITKLPKIIRDERYDLVFCSQVIEHIDKDTVLKSIPIWEKLANKKVLLTTTFGFIPYQRIEKVKKELNPFQKHLSGWYPDDFKKRGYTVRGQGFKFIYGENGLSKKYPSFLPLWQIIGYAFAPLVYYIPSLATYIIALKDVQWKNK